MTTWRSDASKHWKSTGAAIVCGLLLAAGPAHAGVSSSPCPRNAIAIGPGALIQETVDRAGDGAVLCLQNGVHRAQAIRPRPRQRFYGEGQTVLNGSQLLTGFRREEGYWAATSPLQRRSKHGDCQPSAPLCNEPQALFLDDKPLTRVSSKGELTSGKFYIDYAGRRMYLVDDPTNRKVEVTVALFAFQSAAPDVLISNITVEKFANAAQTGAIHAIEGARWIMENCEARLNSGHGISAGTGSRVRNCDIHNNGQLGIGGYGNDILIESNHIWSNNIYGFDPGWEAGGVKIAESDRVTFRGNHVHDNKGRGLWCDGDCRNIVYEDNIIENNQRSGIYHEISFNAVIRNNRLRHNHHEKRDWFWSAEILIAGSQDVEVSGNTLVADAGICGVMLIDQGRHDNGPLYKTRNNTIRGNDMTFEGGACAGGASDTKPGHDNYNIIEDGNNRFDGNTYRVARPSEPRRFVWGHEVTDWDGFRRKGLEKNGRLVP
jgi:parallel beta-helix repeat protein